MFANMHAKMGATLCESRSYAFVVIYKTFNISLKNNKLAGSEEAPCESDQRDAAADFSCFIVHFG
jgi:hypothetical protein